MSSVARRRRAAAPIAPRRHIAFPRAGCQRCSLLSWRICRRQAKSRFHVQCAVFCGHGGCPVSRRGVAGSPETTHRLPASGEPTPGFCRRQAKVSATRDETIVSAPPRGAPTLALHRRKFAACRQAQAFACNQPTPSCLASRAPQTTPELRHYI
ncbi:hypothetical protein DFH06DRAFT_94860 [Mycena polygramma]|nr:hypothetical protein DFH06DRAFT_94860 [Mycena polygramma]